MVKDDRMQNEVKDMAKIGDMIRDIRIDRNLTQEELAERADMSRSTLAKYEAGIVGEPSISSLIKIADALDVSIDYMTGRTNIPDLYIHVEEGSEIRTIKKDLSPDDRKQVRKKVRKKSSTGKVPGGIANNPAEFERYVRSLVADILAHPDPVTDPEES